MSDLIRRDEVVERLEIVINHGIPNENGLHLISAESVLKKIKELPTAEPKVGKWLDHSDEGYVECPFCGSLTTCEDNIDELHYCFNCGVKMERSE